MELSLSRRRRQKSPGENTFINSSDFFFRKKNNKQTNKHKSLCSSKVDTIMQAYIFHSYEIIIQCNEPNETRENANRIEVN